MNTNLIVTLGKQALELATEDWRVSAGLVAAGVAVGIGSWLYRKIRRS